MALIAIAGPPGVGKSSLALEVGKRTGLPICRMDADRFRRFRRWGYNKTRAHVAFQSGGAIALHGYTARFELRDLDLLMAINKFGVLDLGGGVLGQWKEGDRRTLQVVLERVDLLVLLVPYPDDIERTVRLLLARIERRGRGDHEVTAWLARGGRRLVYRLVEATLACSHLRCATLYDNHHSAMRGIMDFIAKYS